LCHAVLAAASLAKPWHGNVTLPFRDMSLPHEAAQTGW
jgi:hypothetical protein